MNFASILNKSKAALLFLYNNFTQKFINIFSKVKETFPILDKYPILKYSMIPVLIGTFFLLRYVLKALLNEIAAWTSTFVGETTSYDISEGSIVMGLGAAFMIFKVVTKVIDMRKKNTEEPSKESNINFGFLKGILKKA